MRKPLTSEELSAIRELLDRAVANGSTHWEGCVGSHWGCAVHALLEEVARLRAINARKTTRIKIAEKGPPNTSSLDAQGLPVTATQGKVTTR